MRGSGRLLAIAAALLVLPAAFVHPAIARVPRDGSIGPICFNLFHSFLRFDLG